MRGKRIEYKVGQMINGLVYLGDFPSKSRDRRGLFVCYCGKMFDAYIRNVVRGHTNSCGCFKDMMLRRRAKHGLTNHWVFGRWADIKSRCYNENSHAYKYYGGRGIVMHKQWVHDFKSFYDYVTQLPNYKKSLTIDRIDNNGNYEPGNLRWATMKQQNNNSRRCKKCRNFS